MSQDGEFSFEQGEQSEFELTSNSLEFYVERIASCSESMEYHLSDSDDEEQIFNKQKGQEENEIIFNSQYKPITSCLKSMEYPIDISDENGQVDHLETGHNGNVMVSDDQLKSTVCGSKSVEYHLSDISDEDEQIENISMEQKGNETIVLNELDEKFVKNNLPTGWKRIIHDSGIALYFNKDLNVCSFTKPYYLGTQSLKNHNIPVENTLFGI